MLEVRLDKLGEKGNTTVLIRQTLFCCPKKPEYCSLCRAASTQQLAHSAL